MKYRISFPTAFKEINPYDDNMDVCIETEKGDQYTIVAATYSNYARGQAYPALLLNELTQQNIVAAIEKISVSHFEIIKRIGTDIDYSDEDLEHITVCGEEVVCVKEL